MRSFRLALLGTAMLASAVLPALAQPAPGAHHRPLPAPVRGRAALPPFARIDANNDGRVTWDEAWAYVQARFAEADTDHDGGSDARRGRGIPAHGPAARGRPRRATPMARAMRSSRP